MTRPQWLEYLPETIGVLHEDDALLHANIITLVCEAQEREHVAVVRLVQHELGLRTGSSYYMEGARSALGNILAALAKRRGGEMKGKRLDCPMAWAWEIKEGLCYWAAPSKKQLDDLGIPSPEAKMVCVRLVKNAQFKSLVSKR